MRVLLLYVLPIAIVLYAFFDCARTPQEQVRRLPKWAWILIIIFFDLIGALVWFFVGRPKKNPGSNPKRGPKRPIAPDDDPDFLKSL